MIVLISSKHAIQGSLDDVSVIRKELTSYGVTTIDVRFQDTFREFIDQLHTISSDRPPDKEKR